MCPFYHGLHHEVRPSAGACAKSAQSESVWKAVVLDDVSAGHVEKGWDEVGEKFVIDGWPPSKTNQRGA